MPNFAATAINTSTNSVDLASATRRIGSKEGAGVVGAADKLINDASMKLINDSDSFALTGNTPKEKFYNTWEQFARGGTSAGCIFARGVMLPEQLIFGSGHPDKEDTGLGTKIMHNGIVGAVIKGETALISGVAGVGGGVAGAVAGLVYSPIAITAHGGDALSSTIHGAKNGSKGAAQATGILLGTAQGIPLGVVRGAVTVVKASIGLTGGILGAAVGLPVAAVRAGFDL